MKNFLIILLLLVCSLAAIPNDNAEMQRKFQQSKTKWQTFRKQCNNTYNFDITWNSATGGWVVKTVHVKDGKPNAVTHRYFDDNGTCYRTINKTTGQMDKNEKTLDDIYDFVANQVINRDPRSFNLFLELDENGLIEICGYAAPDGTHFTGYNITGIQLGGL